MQESLNEQLLRIEHTASEIDSYVDQSKGSMLGGSRVTLSRDQMYIFVDEIKAAIDEIKKMLPGIFNAAQRIKNEEKQRIDDAKIQANKIIESAENRAAQIMSEDQIAVNARAIAEQIQNEAYESSETLKRNARIYVDNILVDIGKKIADLANMQHERLADLQDYYETTSEEIKEHRLDIRRDV